MSITRRENFDTIAAHLAENIVDVMSMAPPQSMESMNHGHLYHPPDQAG